MGTASVTPFDQPQTRGFLHRPTRERGDGLVLTHGAGSNCNAPLLVAVASALCDAGMTVLRCDLAFRQRRAKGPPSPATAAEDRVSIKHAVTALQPIVPGPIFLGGHSYGGRQASMLAADEPQIAAALLLLSYPLHPPAKPEQRRTQHFPRLHVPALFVQGATDPFATIAELEAARALIPAATQLVAIERAGHDLRHGRFDLAPLAAALRALALKKSTE
jgi:uncharacterized protein